MNRLTDKIKRYGIAGCLSKAVLRLGRAAGITYFGYKAYYKELSASIAPPALPPYRRMTLKEFQEQSESDPQWLSHRKLEQIAKYINKPGFAYYGVFEGERLMSYGGLSLEYDNFLYRVNPPETAYLFDAYTNPLYRGRGLHRQIIAIREHEAYAAGKSATYAYVLSSNLASAKGFKRGGYEARFKVTFKQIGKRQTLEQKILPL